MLIVSLNSSKVLATFATSIVRVDIVKGYKGCNCQSVCTKRRYDGCEVYTAKQKWLVGLARNFFQLCDHSAMNTHSVGVSPISPYTFRITTQKLRHAYSIRESKAYKLYVALEVRFKA